MVTSYTILIQYEDQEGDIDSPQSLSKFHQIYMHVCVRVHVSMCVWF